MPAEEEKKFEGDATRRFLRPEQALQCSARVESGDNFEISTHGTRSAFDMHMEKPNRKKTQSGGRIIFKTKKNECENNVKVYLREIRHDQGMIPSSSSFYWPSVANAPNVLQPYWLVVLPLDVPALTASLLL